MKASLCSCPVCASAALPGIYGILGCNPISRYPIPGNSWINLEWLRPTVMNIIMRYSNARARTSVDFCFFDEWTGYILAEPAEQACLTQKLVDPAKGLSYSALFDIMAC